MSQDTLIKPKKKFPTFSDPRLTADDTATFFTAETSKNTIDFSNNKSRYQLVVESTRIGERVVRKGGSKPRYTVFAVKMVIVTGSDGSLYFLSWRPRTQTVVVHHSDFEYNLAYVRPTMPELFEQLSALVNTEL